MSHRILTALLAVLATSCGAGVALEEHAPTLGTGTVCFQADGGGQCPSDLAWAEGEAQHLLVVAGLLAPGAHLPARVEVQPHDVWREWGAEVLGIAPVSAIRVGPGLEVLVHESLHIVDFSHGAAGTITHQGWSTNGYNTLAGMYSFRLWQHRGSGYERRRATVAGTERTEWLHAYAWGDLSTVCDATAGMPASMLDAVRADAPTRAALNGLRGAVCASPEVL